MRSNIVQLGGETEEVRKEMAEEKPRQETLEKEAGNFPHCWSRWSGDCNDVHILVIKMLTLGAGG